MQEGACYNQVTNFTVRSKNKKESQKRASTDVFNGVARCRFFFSSILILVPVERKGVIAMAIKTLSTVDDTLLKPKAVTMRISDKVDFATQ